MNLSPISSRRVFAWSPAVLLILCAAHSGAEEFTYPVSIAVDRSGTVFVADRNLPGIWRLERDRLSLCFQGSKRSRTPLSAVRCVAVDSEGRLLAGDSSTRDIYRFDEAGKPRGLTDQGNGQGLIGIPMDIAVDAEGDLLVSDLEQQRIVKVPKEGGRPEPLASAPAPRGLFYDSQKRLWVVSGRRLLRLSPEGKMETIVNDGTFQFPHDVAVSDDGMAYVSDGHARAIWKIVPGERPKKWVSGEPLINPVGLGIDHGKLLAVDPRAKAMWEIGEAGTLKRREARLTRKEHRPARPG